MAEHEKLRLAAACEHRQGADDISLACLACQKPGRPIGAWCDERKVAAL